MAMSFDASSLYTSDYYKTANETAQMESKLKTDNLSEASEDELLKVCKDFESYFVEQMFKAMERMVPKEESGTNEVKMFGDLMYQELAASATKQQDYGIAQKLFEQMKRNYGLE